MSAVSRDDWMCRFKKILEPKIKSSYKKNWLGSYDLVDLYIGEDELSESACIVGVFRKRDGETLGEEIRCTLPSSLGFVDPDYFGGYDFLRVVTDPSGPFGLTEDEALEAWEKIDDNISPSLDLSRNVERGD